MKKFILILTALMLALTGSALADSTSFLIDGVIQEVGEEGFALAHKIYGTVYVNVTEKTEFYGLPEVLTPGLHVSVLNRDGMHENPPYVLQAHEVAALYLEGTVTEVTEGVVLMETLTHGQVAVQVGDGTLLEGFEALTDLAVGQQIRVDYNGMMTRSLPAQISADKITAYSLSGQVTEVMENAFILETETHGPVIVNTLLPLPEAGQQVTVDFDGVMTLSLPARIGAWQIR